MGVLRSTHSMQAEVEEMRAALFHGGAAASGWQPSAGDADFKRATGDQQGAAGARTVCVTGGISFVGFAIVDRLLRHGYTVRLALETQEDLDKLREMEMFGDDGRDGVWTVMANVMEPESLHRAFDGCAGVFHTSAFVDPRGMSGYTVRLSVHRCCFGSFFFSVQTFSSKAFCHPPIAICRHLVLREELDSVGLSMHETTTRDDESNELLTVVHVDVPPHICMPRLETTLFYGDWSLTTEAALQSACSTALVYLRKVNIVAIDGIHSPELKSCQRKLLEASSWSEAFQTHAAKLQSQLTAVAEEKEIPTAKKCPAVNLLSPLKESDAPLILQNIVKEKMPDISPCLATPNKLVEASARYAKQSTKDTIGAADEENPP